MKTSRITQYDPTLSIEENAANNNVTTAAIRSYIQKRGIDRATDRQIYLYNKIKEYASKHPQEKAPQIADALGLTANTVRRYMKMTEEPQPKEKKTTTINQADKLKFISISDNQIAILKTILAIHLPKRKNFQCDLTAWKLGFYKDGLEKPIYCYDKYASILNNDDIEDLANFETDWQDGTFDSIVIDLPCSIELPSTKSRFDVSPHFSNLPELFEEHEKMLNLAHQKMQTGGILVYKVMDFTFYGSPYWLSDEVLRMAKEIGFELADKYIYIDPRHNKIDRRRTKYTAAVPAHAYFFVFKKKRKCIEED
ncbi:MAG: hypothetical protein K2M07_02605 [Muribaculaceae bacterium]|nr:hypothetical protein [Muribaculaceae bacterium]